MLTKELLINALTAAIAVLMGDKPAEAVASAKAAEVVPAATGRRGRPPAAAATPAEAAPKAAELTYEGNVKPAFTSFLQLPQHPDAETASKRAVAIIAKFNVRNARELKPEQFADVLKTLADETAKLTGAGQANTFEL